MSIDDAAPEGRYPHDRDSLKMSAQTPVTPGTYVKRSGPIAWLSVILALYAAHVVYLNCVVEDAYITLRFAKHLASGLGLIWNRNEPPVEGYTNFLWVLVSAGAIKAGLEAPRFLQVAGTLFGAATILLTYAAGRLAGWPRGLAVVPPLMLAVSGPFATWSASGMETVPFTSFVLAGVLGLGKYWQQRQPKWLVAMSLALVAAALTRPEGLMVFAVLMGLSLVLSVGEFRRGLGHHVAAAACWAVPLGLYIAWRYAYFGYLLPNTFYAKTGGGLEQIKRGTLTSLLFASQFVGPLVPWALVALWETGARPLTAPRFAGIVAGARRDALLVASCVVVAVYTAYIVVIGNDYMAMHRFFVPLLPLIYLVGTGFLALLLPGIGQRSRSLVVAGLVALAAGATLFHSTPLERYFVAKVPHQHGNHQGVQIARRWAARLTLLAEFFKGYVQSRDESLGTNAIGIIGYVGDFNVYDPNGLVDVHIAHAPPDKLDALMGHQREDYAHILTKKPTYMMFARELTRTSGDVEGFVPPDVWPTLQQEYVVRSVWLTDKVNRESGYFSFFERRDNVRPDKATSVRDPASRSFDRRPLSPAAVRLPDR